MIIVLGWMVLTIYSWLLIWSFLMWFPYFTKLFPSLKCSLSVRHASLLCNYTESWNRRVSTTMFGNLIETRAGKGTNTFFWTGTAYHANTWQRTGMIAAVPQRVQELGTCHTGSNPGGVAAHLSGVPSMSHSCRDTRNCTGRWEKLSAYIDHYFRT